MVQAWFGSMFAGKWRFIFVVQNVNILTDFSKLLISDFARDYNNWIYF